MVKDNKTCIVCGKKYSYCSSCGEYSHLPSWYSIFHDENCRNLFNITRDYLEGVISDNAARARYNLCDLSYKDYLHEKIKDTIDVVFGFETDLLDDESIIKSDKIRNRKRVKNDK